MKNTLLTGLGVLNAPGETNGKPTRIMISEWGHARSGFLVPGMQIDRAPIRAGKVPIHPQALSPRPQLAMTQVLETRKEQ